MPVSPAVGELPLHIRPFTSDLAVLNSLLGENEYGRLRAYLPHAHSIIDLGANIGASIRLWTKWFPHAQIVAVEPDPDNYRLAKRNVPAKAQVQVRLLNRAAHETDGFLYLNRDCEPWSIRTDDTAANSRSVKIATITIPELIELLPAGPIDLLKCDIEGAEEAVFRNCGSWINLVRVIAIETHQPYSMTAFQNDLCRAGASHRLVWQEDHGDVTSVALFVEPELVDESKANG